MPLPGEPLSSRLAGLFVYPVKSCAALGVASARVEERGLAGDRRWMVVDPDGRFLTQRTEPRLALVRPHLRSAELWLAADGHTPVRVELGEERMPCTVWGSRVDAARAGEGADRWLSAFLGRPARLVHLDGAARRRVRVGQQGPTYEVSFADELPLLVTAQASLDELNARLRRPVPMDRFRPNLVLEASEPFAEDRWRRIAVGACEFELVKPAARCAVVSVDQASGERDPEAEPLATLARFRRGAPREGLEPGEPGGVFFGVRAAPLASACGAELCLCDPVRVLSTW